MLRCSEPVLPVPSVPVRQHQSNDSSTWQGTTATWDSVTNLPLNDSVDVVKFLNTYLDFHPDSDEDYMHRIASLIFKYDGEAAFTLSQIEPWIIDQKCILQQNLQRIYDAGLIPEHAKSHINKALQYAGEILTVWLFDLHTAEDENEDDDFNGFFIHYQQDLDLQTHLTSSSDLDHDDDEMIVDKAIFNTIDGDNTIDNTIDIPMDNTPSFLFVQDQLDASDKIQRNCVSLSLQDLSMLISI